MRHHGMRVIISTQSPKSISPELLELVTVTFIHRYSGCDGQVRLFTLRFHSPDWFQYLKDKIPLDSSLFQFISDLQTGHAVVFSKSWSSQIEPGRFLIPGMCNECVASVVLFSHWLGFALLKIRRRLTEDVGYSKVSPTTI